MMCEDNTALKLILFLEGTSDPNLHLWWQWGLDIVHVLVHNEPRKSE